ncbi:hypothetical protein BCF89_11117, partial [Metamycoplasma auris]
SKLNELKKQTEDLVKDLESKIEKVKKAKFDKDKLEEFRKENKENKDLLDYVENLKDDTFAKLQKEFTDELNTFVEDLKEILKEIEKKELKEEDVEDHIEQNKGISELVKEQFTIFEKVSKY